MVVWVDKDDLRGEMGKKEGEAFMKKNVSQ